MKAPDRRLRKESKLVRVFPRKTTATPADDSAFYDGPPMWYAGSDDVHVSCTFTYDKPRAEFLAEQWHRANYKVTVGGPAYDDRGDEFTPGRYLKPGYVITSRGCNNKCWFCKVPKREGSIRELEIKDGYDLLDNNLLQCSEDHIRGVFEMLGKQDRRDRKGKKIGVSLTGGLEAAILQDWHVDLFASLKPKPEIIYFAYDTPQDLEPLIWAAKKMRAIGFNNQRVGCYVLMGWAKDTIDEAQRRLQTVVDLDMMPHAMVFEDQKQSKNPIWNDLQRNHTRPAITRRIHKGQFGRFLKQG